jgi:predicted hydrocarbon binding protein
MGIAKHGMLAAMEGCVENVAGRAVAAKVMEGSEQITEKTDKRKTALWVKGAMERLDKLVDDETKKRIMQNCGYNCAKKNSKVIERAVARRKKFGSTDEFLVAEQQKPMKGTRLSREGNILYQYYIPQAFTRPMRCYCGLLRELPTEETVSITYCNCSRGFVEKYWENILGKPVRVDILQSAVSGAAECKFAIHL